MLELLRRLRSFLTRPPTHLPSASIACTPRIDPDQVCRAVVARGCPNAILSAASLVLTETHEIAVSTAEMLMRWLESDPDQMMASLGITLIQRRTREYNRGFVAPRAGELEQISSATDRYSAAIKPEILNDLRHIRQYWLTAKIDA